MADYTTVLAIDPGPSESAWVRFADGKIHRHMKEPNEELWRRFNECGHRDVAVIEQVRSYGMPVGAEVFDTVHWSGRFHELARGRGMDVCLLPRKDVKLHLCGSPRANDATIRQALIDHYGGKAAAIGTKAKPGPLYGIKADIWQALALGVTWQALHGGGER